MPATALAGRLRETCSLSGLLLPIGVDFPFLTRVPQDKAWGTLFLLLCCVPELRISLGLLVSVAEFSPPHAAVPLVQFCGRGGVSASRHLCWPVLEVRTEHGLSCSHLLGTFATFPFKRKDAF